MKKEVKTGLFVLLIIGSIILGLSYKNKTEVTKTKRKKHSNLAILIKEDGATDYTKSSSKDIPIGNYELNYEKSYCKNNGVIGDYDSSVGKVSFSFIGTDSCYLYFDYESDTTFETLMTPNNTDIFEENGIRYEGVDPNNYICLDNQKSGGCNSSLLFRIIGLFDEEYSTDGTTSAGSKKLLKVIDTNNYGGTEGKYWDESCGNNWNNASLKKELNGTYLTTLTRMSNVNSILEGAIATTKWHLGGPSDDNYATLTADGIYTEERNISAIYSDNPSSLYAKIGLMYASDYGYSTVGNSTTNRSNCRNQPLLNGESYSDCLINGWLFSKQSNFSAEWLVTPSYSTSPAAFFTPDGYVLFRIYMEGNLCREIGKLLVRPTFYLDADMLKIAGGTGSQTDPYHIK